MKGHHSEKRISRFCWAQMGWVPVQGGHPVYVVGEQVIGTTGFTDTATPGITEHTLSGASRFGVDLPADLEQARADLRKLVDVYYSGGAWADRRLGALVVAAGIRPAVPIRPHTTIYFEGKRPRVRRCLWIPGSRYRAASGSPPAGRRSGISPSGTRCSTPTAARLGCASSPRSSPIIPSTS